jgi:hypothetical protein
VLIIPGMLVLVMTVAQFVVYFHAYHLATAAAQEGVRAAQLADGSEDGARLQTQDFLAQAGPNLVLLAQVDVARDADSARVEVRGQAPQLIPGIRVGIHTVARGPVERFVADPSAP